MVLPNAARAFVEPSKVRDYLLSLSHPVGRFKAAVFSALGYHYEHWEVLRDDLLALVQVGEAVLGQPSQADTGNSAAIEINATTSVVAGCDSPC